MQFGATELQRVWRGSRVRRRNIHGVSLAAKLRMPARARRPPHRRTTA